jgi:hypothetical protein
MTPPAATGPAITGATDHRHIPRTIDRITGISAITEHSIRGMSGS